MEMISLDNIHFSYNGTPVIKGISYNAAGGSFTAVLGPNGSGKTTLIRLINGMLSPQEGRVELKGRSTAGIKAATLAKEMAYVPQREQNVFSSTVFDTVLLGRNPYISWAPAQEDRRHQHEVLQLLRDLSQNGITMLMAIHDLNLAIKYCSDFMVLDEGQLVARGGREIFNEELIEQVYRVKVKIVKEDGHFYILPLEPL
jgi:iron complex transport system ATP-binding protein